MQKTMRDKIIYLKFLNFFSGWIFYFKYTRYIYRRLWIILEKIRLSIENYR